MNAKVVLIGGGSYGWTPTLAKDIFLREPLAGSNLVLVDIQPDAAELLRRYCVMLAERIGTGWTVSVADHDTALDGADAVGISISTGDVETMHFDYTVPERFGVYHTVSDTVGPGGISRTLRNVPVFVDIAGKMAKLCPNAWIVNVTNPLTQLTRTVWKVSDIRCVGLCHNYAGTMAFLADFFGVDYDDMDAVSVGVNHGTFLKDITIKGAPVETSQLTVENYLRYEAKKKGPLKTGTTDDEIEAMFGQDESLPFLIAFELYELFGVWPVGSAPHIAENWPFFLNKPETIRRHRIRRKGVLPGRRDGKNKRRDELADIVEGRAEMPNEFQASREGLSVVVESLLTGTPSRVIGAMPNKGQIRNLPPDVVVETWCMVGRGGVEPVASGEVPYPLAGMMQTIVDEQELAVEAALTGDRQKLVQAVWLSPLLADKDKAAELADALIEATKQWLPQFRK